MMAAAIALSSLGFTYRADASNPNPVLAALAQSHHRPSIAEAEEAFYEPGNLSAPLWLAELASSGDSRASILLATLLQHCQVLLSKLAVAELCVVLHRGKQPAAGGRQPPSYPGGSTRRPTPPVAVH